ncbi:MAG: hypothetical protein IH591_13685 [Bacteroidales bacterium]|nr:hypothetical protein [Bacteroidales bacterium]
MGFKARQLLVYATRKQEATAYVPSVALNNNFEKRGGLMLRFMLIASFMLISSAVLSQKTNHLKYQVSDPYVYDFCFSRGGTILAYTDGMTVRLCNPHTMEQSNHLSGGHTDRILTIDMSADSSMIATGGRDGLILIWDRLTGSVINRLDYNREMVTAISFDPSGTGIISGSLDGRLVYYDLSEDKIRFEKNVHQKIITAVAVSPIGGIIASVGADKILYITETTTGNVILNTSDHMNWIRDLEFSPDGSRMATSGDDRNVMVYNTSNRLNINKMPGKIKEPGRINSVDINNDNMSLVFGLDNGQLMVRTVYSRYSINIGKPVTEVKFIPGMGMDVVLVAATYGSGIMRIPMSGMRMINKK